MTGKDRRLVLKAQRLSSTELSQFLSSSASPLPDSYQFECAHGQELSSAAQDAIFNLFELNMKTFYEQSHDGYNPEEKRKELFDLQSRHLLIQSKEGLMAFAHFRFDMDYGSPVLYLYELQVHPSCQGHGIGYWCMERLKWLAAECQMRKIVLTVYKTNERAAEFYRKKCHFDLDTTNPDTNAVDYLILSISTVITRT